MSHFAIAVLKKVQENGGSAFSVELLVVDAELKATALGMAVDDVMNNHSSVTIAGYAIKELTPELLYNPSEELSQQTIIELTHSLDLTAQELGELQNKVAADKKVMQALVIAGLRGKEPEKQHNLMELAKVLGMNVDLILDDDVEDLGGE
jgi:hypothetical protein